MTLNSSRSCYRPTVQRVWLRPPITAMPTALYGALQHARAGLLRLATPLDAGWRAMLGRDSRAPLWLRRHVGAIRHVESSARQTTALLRDLGLVRPDDHVLDIGCGIGTMAFELASLLDSGGRYIGFDVNRAAIAWCRSALGLDSRFRFDLADVASPYGPTGRGSPESYRFPTSDHEADLVLAKSVFTHLLEGEARHYLREVQRTLKKGRAALVTAFLFEEGSLTDRGRSPIFPFPDEGRRIRWRWKARPAAAVAYRRDLFAAMIADAGLRIHLFCRGFSPGNATAYTGQDVLFLGH